jgi:regulator of protease activity HflC (stomatin/prohibitin superfamily)
VTTYKVSDIFDFSGTDEQIDVQFNDAARGKVPGFIKYRLPTTDEKLLRIHQDFRSDDAVHFQLVQQAVRSAVVMAAKHFRAEEVYSTRSAEFLDLVNDQVREGVFATTFTDETIKDELDPTKTKLVKGVRLKLDSTGNRIVNEESGFHQYGVELVQLVLGNPDFDEKTDALIAERKNAEQNRIVAIANAELAKQAAITAMENGKRDIAIAEAAALVEQKTAVVNAERERKVAEQQALQAEELKKATISKGEAEAQAAKLKVAAGLTPQERAMVERDTAIGVAQALASVKLPALMVMGSGQNGQQLDPFQAVGLESLLRMSKAMGKQE